jgi:predicted nucleic acid-binding Zn ribbon protein
MREQPSPIKDVLGAVISSISGEKKQRIDRIRQAWDKILDKKAQKHVRLASFKTNPHSRAGRLVVDVDSSAWMYEMNLRRQQLKKDLNKQLAGVAIDEIILRIGEIG